MIRIYPYVAITSNTGDLICMFIIESFRRENSQSEPFCDHSRRWIPRTPNPVKSCSAEKDKEFTGKESQQIVLRLLFAMQNLSINGKRSTLMAVAGEFHVNRRTIRRIWERAQENFQNPDIRQFRASPRKKKKCGRHKKWNHDEICKVVTLIPLFKRRTIRDLAHALGIPKLTLWDLKQDKDNPVIIACMSALKPLLTQQHELLHVTFCLTKIDLVTCEYDDCFQSVHVDEKWFFISEKELHLYIVPGEVVPTRRCQNRDHLLKVMFLVAAVARPHFDAEGE